MKAIIISGVLTAIVVILPKDFTNINLYHMETTLNETVVMEIALFKIKKENAEDFKTKNREAIDMISTFDGYVRSSTYQSISDSTLYLDIVEWESLEHAQKAGKIVETDPGFSAYMNSIEEVRYFDHTSVLPEEAFGILKYREQHEGDILELASFYLKDQEIQEFAAARIELMDQMGSTYPGFKGVSTIRSLKDPTHLIDLGNWENAAVCERAQKDLESDPAFLRFMSYLDLEKEASMEFFVKIR